MVAQDIAFWVLAAGSVTAALAVVHLKDLFRAALFLVLTFLAVAGFLVLLGAEFLAVAQVLIYAGAISILIIFAVMLTRDVQTGNPFNRLQVAGLTVSALLLVAISLVAMTTDWHLMLDALSAQAMDQVNAQAFTRTPWELGRLFITRYALAMVTAAGVLLGAIVGALALVRER